MQSATYRYLVNKENSYRLKAIAVFSQHHQQGVFVPTQPKLPDTTTKGMANQNSALSCEDNGTSASHDRMSSEIRRRAGNPPETGALEKRFLFNIKR